MIVFNYVYVFFKYNIMKYLKISKLKCSYSRCNLITFEVWI